MNNVRLIEDHDEALGVWRKEGIKDLDLVHIDAHMDFSFYAAKPLEAAVEEAKSVKELKQSLERSLSFLDYESDFNKQANIGNYIYPAMREGLVKNFYWVIPGEAGEIKKSKKAIERIIKSCLSSKGSRELCYNKKRGVFEFSFLGRMFYVCGLDHLPLIHSSVLLDIDTDFLVINSVKNADNHADIGRRKPWMTPDALVNILNKKIKSPEVITISYSVNGGWTPIAYKHWADELAYCFSPRKFKNKLRASRTAAQYFGLFNLTGEKRYYWAAARIDPRYRAADNNDGPLFLSVNKLSLAEKEFNHILRADKRNPACLLGMGRIYFLKGKFCRAKSLLESAINLSKASKLFKETKDGAIFSLAKLEFKLGNLSKAKKLLFLYKRLHPLEGECYFLLGRILKKEGKLMAARKYDKDAGRLGYKVAKRSVRQIKFNGKLRGKVL